MQYFLYENNITLKFYDEERDTSVIAKLKKLANSKQQFGLLFSNQSTKIDYDFHNLDESEAEISISNPMIITDQAIKERPVWLAVGLKYLLENEIIDKKVMNNILTQFTEKNNEYVENFLNSNDMKNAGKK